MTLIAELAIARDARADDYPSKTIRIIVPFPPGGGVDIRARQLAPLLSQRFGHGVVVDNRPGAAGNIGASVVAHAAPDGHTLLAFTDAIFTVNPHLTPPDFDALRDLVPIIITSRAPMFMVTNAASSLRSIKDLVEQARANPGKLTYGTSGEGSVQHFMGERFKQAAGIDMLAVPYKGNAPALQDLANAQINLCFGGGSETAGLVQSGKLKILAVTSAKRLARFPDLPTVQEAGVAGYAETVSLGYAVPRGTPPAAVRKLNEAIRAAVLKLEDKQEFSKVGAEVVANLPEEAAAWLKADYERYGKLVEELELKPK